MQYTRPWLYPKQEKAIFSPTDRNGDPARFSWIEASTKAGKTVGCLAWLFEQCLFGSENANHWWVAPIFTQAEIAYRRLKQGLPEFMFKSNEQKMTITLPGNRIIWFKSADRPDSLYGEDVHSAVIDEASRARQEAFFAVRSTLTATRGPCRIIGNVKGRKNWFYRNAREAEKGKPDHSFYRITAADAVAAGVLHADEIEGARHDLPEAVFKELYEAEASDDQGNPFGIKYIEAATRKMLAPGPVYWWGVDLAKKQDWTVIIGLNAKGEVCHFERFQKPWEDTTDILIKTIGMKPAMIDSTGVGDPIVERVQKRCNKAVGYHFTQPSKQKLMEGLAVALQRGETTVLEGEHKIEMESFEYTYTRTGVSYSAPEGYSDDTVCSHALAVMCKARGVDLSVWEKLNGPARKAA